MTKVGIINCGIGNLRSVQKAFERFQVKADIVSDASQCLAAEALVLPGVGAFRDAMAAIEAQGLLEAIRQAVLSEGRPILGICLGMQLLAERGTENGDYVGLGLIDGTVEKLEVATQKDWAGRPLTLPHIGWNDIKPIKQGQLLRGIASGSDFYFVHSYHVACRNPNIVAATSEYGSEFCCAIEHGNIFAVQFHPEKSQGLGAKVIRNFLQASSALRAAA